MKTKIFIVLASVALLAACSRSKNGYEAVNNTEKSSSADTAANYAADSVSNEVPKLVKTADMNLKVKNVQKTGDSIAAITKKYQGMVTHHKMTSEIVNSQDVSLTDDSIMRVSAFNTTADMQVKIPSEKLEEFMNHVSHLGMYITSRQMDIEDKSLDYLSAKLKLQSRKELVAQQKKGKIVIKNPEAVLWLKDDMVDGQIANQAIDAAVKYSNISLNFYQSNTIVNEKIANDDPAVFQLPFFTRLYMSLGNGWLIFTEFVLTLANLWILFLAGGGAWLIYKTYRKKPMATI